MGRAKHLPVPQTGPRVIHPNVSRVDYPRSHGFLVRFQRTQGGVKAITSKLFSDSTYGKTARVKAIAWREAMAKTLRAPYVGRSAYPPGYNYVKRMRVTNSVNGVRHSYMAYVAFLRIEDGRHLMTRWSIEKWGASTARERCNDWVARKTGELERRLRGSVDRQPNTRRVTTKPARDRPTPARTKSAVGKKARTRQQGGTLRKKGQK